ncbi:MAG: hypothetical protein JJ850_05130 [Kordiimonadaceae bacterium]|nr:hypothetical protein [Kordiimonadaceae bacterium]MBO6568295.1 hypothetical protein [Kordiimonadaceae bacterium]MBO6963975.1 hypothetical protein [Kordiimonadaceae bacterium]
MKHLFAAFLAAAVCLSYTATALPIQNKTMREQANKCAKRALSFRDARRIPTVTKPMTKKTKRFLKACNYWLKKAPKDDQTVLKFKARMRADAAFHAFLLAEFEQAIDHGEAAMEIAQTQPIARSTQTLAAMVLGSAYALTGEKEKAITHAALIDSLDPHDPVLRRVQAQILGHSERGELYGRSMEQVVKLWPAEGSFLELAMIYIAQDKRDAAIEVLEAALNMPASGISETPRQPSINAMIARLDPELKKQMAPQRTAGQQEIERILAILKNPLSRLNPKVRELRHAEMTHPKLLKFLSQLTTVSERRSKRDAKRKIGGFSSPFDVEPGAAEGNFTLTYNGKSSSNVARAMRLSITKTAEHARELGFEKFYIRRLNAESRIAYQIYSSPENGSVVDRTFRVFFAVTPEDADPSPNWRAISVVDIIGPQQSTESR